MLQGLCRLLLTLTRTGEQGQVKPPTDSLFLADTLAGDSLTGASAADALYGQPLHAADMTSMPHLAQVVLMRNKARQNHQTPNLASPRKRHG